MRKWFAGMRKDLTAFGAFLEANELQQTEVAAASGVSPETVRRLRTKHDYEPQRQTLINIRKGLRKMGYEISIEDFWE